MLVFELLYKFATVAVFRPILSGLMHLALKIQGIPYLSDETMSAFLRAPSSWVLLIVIVLAVAFFTLFDICCIIICIHASYRKQRIPLLVLMKKGLAASGRVIYQRRNILMIFYLLIIIPMTHAFLMSGYVTEFALPEFIMEYIFSHKLLAAVYVAFWIYIGLRSFHWIYSLHYFCLEGCNFKQARRKSWILMGKHYWRDMILILVWNGALTGAYYGIVMFGSWLVSKLSSSLGNWDMFCSLTISGVSLMLDICGAFFFCFCMPLVFLCISLMFYYYKAVEREPIAPAFTDLREAYRLTQTAWARKLYQHRKRIIAISLCVVIGVNFAYNIADRTGVMQMGLKQEVEVTAHRGYSSVYPENTIPAFKGAIEIGADWIELDVQETADGEVVVMHDSSLKRTTGVDKEVWETDYDEIRELDNGSWKDPKYQAVRIPTLEEALSVTRGKIRLNIEIKPTGHEKHLEERVVELLRKMHMAETCVISSMKYDCLQKVKEIDPDITTVYITSVSYGNFNVLKYADGYSVESMTLTQRFINAAHKAGKEVYVWTVNSEDTLEKVIGMGADKVITDDPVMAQKIIYEKEHSSFWDEYINRLLKISK